MRILNLRSTSGGGKSTIVRHLMKQFPYVAAQFVENRKQPIGYLCLNPTEPDRPPLFVLGHYETACGGGDTISRPVPPHDDKEGLDLVYALIRDELTAGHDVVYEGLVIASDVKRCADLRHDHALLVIHLDTPLQTCIEGVESRRDAKQEQTGRVRPPLKQNKQGQPKTIVAKYKALITQRAQFRAISNPPVDFRVLNREQALAAALSHFELS